jgi:hypothetical protein
MNYLKMIMLVLALGSALGTTSCQAIGSAGEGLETMGNDLEHSAQKHKDY